MALVDLSDQGIKNENHNKRGVFVKHECSWWQQSPKLVIFSIKVTVKVTRSFTLVSFERVSFVEYAYQIWSLYVLGFKSYGQG